MLHMEDDQREEGCRRLEELDGALALLVLLILSVCLSWRATALQRRGLCDLLAGRSDAFPDVYQLRLPAGVLAAGALSFFFRLSLNTWEETCHTAGLPRRSAQVNLWAALFVLAAALLRLYDLLFLQVRDAGGSPLPG